MYTQQSTCSTIDPRRYVQDLIQTNVLNFSVLSGRSGVSRQAIERFISGKKVWPRTVEKIVRAARDMELEIASCMGAGVGVVD